MNAFKRLSKWVIVFAITVMGPKIVHGTGLNWPTSQLLPSFSTPATNLDAIDITSIGGPERDLFSSLEGIVNRTQPRIACIDNVQEGGYTWLNYHNLRTTSVNGYSAILKYRLEVAGLVVTDTNQPDTLNLATTIAGVKNELICDPSLLGTLTNSPYSLPIVDDLRGRFTDKYQVYGYLYTNYWPLCTHRIISGLSTNLHGYFRDYLVAVKSATVWLDPATLNLSDKTTLDKFLKDMQPCNGVYTGWWPDEGSGLNWIYQYGIPVLASDWMINASVFGGVNRTITVPDIPPPPPLQNKVYVAMILSDGDNIQYMQHAMKMFWDNPDRGSIPIGWTVSPLAADMDPVMLNYYWSTATPNDCLISGPSGAGYTHMQKWNAANTAAFAKLTDPYLRRTGLRIITIWESVTPSMAQSFATNCPTLLGLTDQSGGNYTTVNLGLRTIGLTSPYTSFTNDIYTSITNAAKNWNGTAPLFLAVQANVWDLHVSELRALANMLDTNKYVVVRPDHLFLLNNSVYGYPSAVTKSAAPFSASSVSLKGMAVPNATNAIAWFEWGTNSNYGSRSTSINAWTSNSPSVTVAGLAPRTTYHYRLAVSNTLGVAYGADKIFTTGNRLKAWGDGSLGQTNVPTAVANAVGISAGKSHGLALKNDGGVVAWGDNSYGQTNVPAGLTGVVELAGGAQHSLALKNNGTVVAWGDNTSGKTNVPVNLTNVVAIAAGENHSLALKADRTVAAWGDNTSGQTNVPANLTNVVAIAAGGQHSLALKADGTVTGWGANTYGQTNVPAGLNYVVGIAAGTNFSLALKADGTSTPLLPSRKWTADTLSGADGSQISSWTDDIGGKNATQITIVNKPKLYSNSMNGHKVVRFSGNQTLAVAAADSPISGAGSFTLVVVFKTISQGASSSSFYQNTGLLGCEQAGLVADWALCINGTQLGAGLGAGTGNCGSDFSLYGGTVVDNKPHIAVYRRCGDTINLFVDGVKTAAQNSLCTSGRGNYNFQIGSMTSISLFFNGDIAEIQLYDRALDDWELVSMDEVLAATYGISTGVAGTVVAWGSNSNGQTNSPASLTNVTAAVCGSTFNLALRGNNTLVGWGNNGKGQISMLPGLTNVAALAGGTDFALAIGNQTPNVTNTIVSGYVSHDLALALPGTDPDGNPLTYRVLSLPAAGALYQSAGGQRGMLINLTNSPVSDPAGQLIFAPAPNETNSPYAQFSFRAEDAFYNSPAGQVTVNIGLPSSPQFQNVTWNPDLEASSAGFNLAFTGSSNATYSVWGSTNLTDWEIIGPAVEISPENYEFSDGSATNWPQRFYRTSAP